MFRLGTFTAETPLLLAPMAGFTDAAMRRICHRFGAALTYTEMINASGVLHASDKTWHLLETFPDEGPVAAHLYGSDPSVLAEAAARVTATGRFVAIDLNAGCPMRKITCKGAGAALMKDPALIGRIVAALRAATPLPVTVKTRLGPRPDHVVVLEILRAVEEAGGAALTVHGRFTNQEHSGEVRLDLLAEVKRASRIPVIGNGGVRSVADALRLFREAGVDAIMIARGATGNPWLFQEIAEAVAEGGRRKAEGGSQESDAEHATPQGTADRTPGHHAPRRDLSEIRAVLEEHLEGEVELRRQIAARHRLPAWAMEPDKAAVTTFRCHLFRYLTGLKGASYVRGQLNVIHTLDDIRAALDGCFEREARYRAQAPWLAHDGQA